jgi:hypothetical protein
MKKCLEEKCDKRPNYNLPNIKTGIYCSIHKKENMIDITRKKCLEKDCNNRANFNLINEKQGIYCSKHKKENMIDITRKKCLEKDCNIQPHYNLPNKTTPIYCSKHKKENMIDIKSTRCVDKNCNTIANYNFINKTPMYCFIHKQKDMIDVKNKKCLYQNCNKQPRYNLSSDKSGLYCKEHKQENIFDIYLPRCLEQKCDIYPVYNLPNNKIGIYCNQHKLENMINVIRNYCKCGLQAKYTKYKGYCFKCYIDLFPDDKIVRLFKIKENLIMNFIKLNYSNEKCIFDKQLQNKLRPDCYINKDNYGIIIECDEHQHKKFSKDEENERMENIQTVINKPIVFIRFNPDNYLLNNKKIMSSFKLNKESNTLEVRNEKEWNNRLTELKKSIDYWLVNKPDTDLTVKYLFYNN